MPYRLLFPLAAAYALIAVPLWLLQQGNPATIDASWHGHEMLFGFALAVIGGFLATRRAPGLAWVLAGTWLLARIGAACGGGPVALVAGLAFPATMLAVTVPPLLANAKRRENRLLPAIIAAMVAADAAWWTGRVYADPRLQTQVLLCMIDLIALLLTIIGGRALRAAVGGHLERDGAITGSPAMNFPWPRCWVARRSSTPLAWGSSPAHSASARPSWRWCACSAGSFTRRMPIPPSGAWRPVTSGSLGVWPPRGRRNSSGTCR